uniref:JmjC domain-containing protein n=1 Tax=Alexandrium catenella TaxID=2925 RepID=A0A7S1LNQ3_ALECA
MDHAPWQQRVLAYLDSCREVYNSLPQDGLQRTLLDALDPGPALVGVQNVTMPIINGDYLPGPWSAAVKRGREKILNRPDVEHRWKSAEELAQEHPDAAELVRHGFRPVKEEWIRGTEVMDALVAGKVAVFDATEVLPRSLFNITMVDIARMHGELASTIPAYHDWGASKGRQHVESLADYAERLQRTMAAPGRPTVPADNHRFVAHPGAEADPPTCSLPPGDVFWRATDLLTRGQARKVLCGARCATHRVTINTRRLSKLPEFDLHKSLGSPSWVSRVQNLLWTGPGPWNWHYDEEDNLLISLNGDMWAIVFTNQNDTDIIAGGLRLADSSYGELRLSPAFNSAFMAENSWWLQKYPFNFVKLKPGMAITVPSMTLHTVLTSDSTRILMNAFMIPEFKASERITAASWFREGRQTDTYLAVRSLKQASIARLWDSRGLGGFFMGTKLEVL